ncbi:hypothetical protein AB0L41_42550 [Amycolatopsis mediterranei]|uniref:hypothetical protein n=1 Tax=Amycolatopsis mediterranei TaxID=33910 RepID=UPI00343CCB20
MHDAELRELMVPVIRNDLALGAPDQGIEVSGIPWSGSERACSRYSSVSKTG